MILKTFDLIFLSTVKIEITGNVTQDQNLRSLLKSDLDNKSKIANVILNHDLGSRDLRSLPSLPISANISTFRSNERITRIIHIQTLTLKQRHIWFVQR